MEVAYNKLSEHVEALSNLEIDNLEEEIAKLEHQLQLLKTLQIIRNLKLIESPKEWQSAVDLDKEILDPSAPKKSKKQRIVEYVKDNPGCRIVDIVKALGVAGSYIHTLLNYNDSLESRKHKIYVLGTADRIEQHTESKKN